MFYLAFASVFLVQWRLTFGSGPFILLGALAQLARAPALQAGGPGFESPTLHQVLYFENTTWFVGD